LLLASFCSIMEQVYILGDFKMTVRDLLYKDDIYSSFNPEDYPDDMSGWGSKHGAFRAGIEAVRPSTIIELGSWKGKSAVHMANICKKLSLYTEIICIDTWLGSFEINLPITSHNSMDLGRKNGYPQVYYKFLANVVRSGMSNCITPLAATSADGFLILSKLKVKADFIYVDAAHDYRTVLGDLTEYWVLLNDGGILVGDDWGNVQSPGVEKAARQFSSQMKVPLYHKGAKYIIQKGTKHNLQEIFSSELVT